MKILKSSFMAIIGLSLLASSSIYAQKGIKDYFKEPNGARPVSMGHAFTGVAEGLPTVLWNPAGLVSINRTEVYLSRYEGFSFTTQDPGTGLETNDNISFNFFNVGVPIENIGTVALSFNLWDLGSSIITDSGNEVSGFDNQSLWMIYGSYATHLTAKIDAGVTMKYIREKLSNQSGGTGTSFAIDLGMLYRPLDDVPLQLGLSLLDMGSDMQFNNANQSDQLPRRIRVGVGYNILKHLLEQDKFNLLLSMDYERFLVGNPAADGLFFGSEFSIEPIVDMLLSMRAGYISEEGDLSGAIIGVGVNWKGYAFDLARELGVNPLSDRTFFALTAHF